MCTKMQPSAPTSETQVPNSTLATLATAINVEHWACEANAQSAVEHAARAGELLIEAKVTVDHGQWLSWLEANTDVDPRMAQHYMRIARELPKLDPANTKRVSHLSLRGAIATLTRQEHREERLERLAGASNAVISTTTGGPLASVILADPPWRYEHVEESRAIENQYPTMSLNDICDLGPQIAEARTDDCVLFLWATTPKNAEAIQVLEAWGFMYRTGAVWDKGKIGMGFYFRQQHELLLVGTSGNGVPTPEPSNRPRSIFREPRTTHSTKPQCVYEYIERAYPDLTKLELFARRQRPGWLAWGNEVVAVA